MTRAHRKGGAIRVVRQKTGAEHSDLAAELARGTGGLHMSLLTKVDGSGFDGDSLSMWFAEAIDQAGLPDACVMHGLRKTAALMLAEVSCATHEIASITGHAALAEIEWYTKAVNQKELATAAIYKLETKATRISSGNRSPSQSGKRKPRG